MRKDVLELVHYDNDKVVVKFKELSNLEKAMNPWVLNYEYVTITRGKNHIMTMISKDGGSWSISWGDNGCTMISDSLLRSRKEIVAFIEKDCFIPLNLDVPNYLIESANVYYNNNVGCWQANFYVRGKSSNIWDKEWVCAKDAINFAKNIVGDCKWIKETAQTGIEIWRAAL